MYIETPNTRNEITSQLCRLVDRTNENDYVNIFKGKKGDCHANLGRVGGEQPLSLGEGCPGTGVVTHELMHTLGRHCLRVWEVNVLPSNL